MEWGPYEVSSVVFKSYKTLSRTSVLKRGLLCNKTIKYTTKGNCVILTSINDGEVTCHFPIMDSSPALDTLYPCIIVIYPIIVVIYPCIIAIPMYYSHIPMYCSHIPMYYSHTHVL